MTREEAIKIIESARAVVLGNGEYDKAMAMAIDALKAEPIKHGVIELTYEEYGELCSCALADELKHGEWLIDKSGSLMCSKCGTLLDEFQKPSRFCPNCGADMRGGDNEVEIMSRYIDIEPYEKDGWYLQKHYHNSYGEVIKTTPLVSVPTAEPNSCEYWDSESRFCALRRPQAEPTIKAYTIEIEPVKHGRWKQIAHPWYECSECGERTAVVNLNGEVVWNYCPHCGARMDLDEVRNE